MALVAEFRLLEIEPEVFAVDARGNLNDLGHDATSTPPLTMPPIVDGIGGRGREFNDDLGLVGDEAVADSTLLLRDCSIHAFLSYEIANASVTDVGTICARGLTGSAAERMLFGAEFEKTSATQAKIRARWQEADGTDAVVAGVAFTVPSGFFHVGIVRRWISTTDCEVEYTINGDSIGTETVVKGDIGNGSGGHFTVGCAGDGVGDYEYFLPQDSIIDSLYVASDAMCAEELRQEYRRVFVHRPAGYQILRAYLPPGEAWTREPDSLIQRWLMVDGDGLGDLLAGAAKLREDFLPDRAYKEALEYWERVTLLSPGPSDTIAVRRARVLGFLRRLLGYQIDDVKHALEPLFGIAAASIDILEYTGLREDDFGTDDITTPPSRIWITRPGTGTIAIAAGVCTVTAANNDNCDWVSKGGAAGDPPWREASISGATGRDVDGAALITKIARTAGGDDALIGHVWRAPNNDALIVGLEYAGASRPILSLTVLAGVQTGPTTRITGPVTLPFWLLTRYVSGTAYEFAISNTGPLTGYGSLVSMTGPASPRWVGFGIFGYDGDLADAADYDFDDAKIYEPNGVRPFAWQAYRDPGLGGTYDRAAAQIQLEKQKPAHTEAAAVDSMDGFALGPTGNGRLGVDPLYPHGPIVS